LNLVPRHYILYEHARSEFDRDLDGFVRLLARAAAKRDFDTHIEEQEE